MFPRRGVGEFTVTISVHDVFCALILNFRGSQGTSVSALVAMTCSRGGSNGTIVAIWTPHSKSFSLKHVTPNWPACCQRFSCPVLARGIRLPHNRLQSQKQL